LLYACLLTYFRQLTASLNQFIREYMEGTNATPPLYTHCKRELTHAILKKLFHDPEFRHAYVHGIVVECSDGIKRRLYPRFFTYSADYPEKYDLSMLLLSCDPDQLLIGFYLPPFVIWVIVRARAA
jgi:hypothetical protein